MDTESPEMEESEKHVMSVFKIAGRSMALLENVNE